MAGKPRKPGQIDNRGGAREGSGRKQTIFPRVLSEDCKARIMDAAKELSEEYGETLEKSYLRLLYKDDCSARAKASIFKTYTEALIVKESVQDVKIEKTEVGPKIYVPPRQEDPALKVISGGVNDK